MEKASWQGYSVVAVCIMVQFPRADFDYQMASLENFHLEYKPGPG
jgi:hypothetical protein